VSQELEGYESKISQMASQLDAQYELSRVADRKTKRAEQDLIDISTKLQQLECLGYSSKPRDQV